MQKNQEKKIALIHDFLLYPGGAEYVLKVLSELYPDAPIYTLLYDKENMKGLFDGKIIHTSFLQNFPRFLRTRKRKWLLPLLSTAPETFDLRDYDLVISSSGAWTKGIVTRLDTKHIAYIHSPMRFVWDYNELYMKEVRGGKEPGICIRTLLSYLRVWDYQAAQRPDVLIANSLYTQKRIKKYYRRDSEIIYPPIKKYHTVTQYSHGTPSLTDKKYFLIVSRLTAYKRIDIAIDVANKLRLPLVIIGEGDEEMTLKKRAGGTVKFLGWQDDETIGLYYKNARALFFTAEDDFGLTIAESLHCGTPVIALSRGGAKEQIQAGLNGEVFHVQNVEIFADALRRFFENEKKYDKEFIKKSADCYGEDFFVKKIKDQVEKIL